MHLSVRNKLRNSVFRVIGVKQRVEVASPPISLHAAYERSELTVFLSTPCVGRMSGHVSRHIFPVFLLRVLFQNCVSGVEVNVTSDVMSR